MIETEKQKQELEKLLANVIKSLSTIAVYNEQTGDWVAKPEGSDIREADENVKADIVEDWNERRATLSQLETRYNNIKIALRKIDEGTYGVCEISGEKIDEDRLVANPAARTCKAHFDKENTLSQS